jgi:hypothetical protein
MSKSTEPTLVDFTPLADPKSDMEVGSTSVSRLATAVSASADFDLGSVQTQPETGLDAFFSRNPEVIKPLKMAGGRRKIASLGDLSGFVRLSNDTLIHKSDRDLWTIKKEADGIVVERLFDDDGKPLKG